MAVIMKIWLTIEVDSKELSKSDDSPAEPQCDISAHQKAFDKDFPPMKRGPQIHTGFISPRPLHGAIQIM